MIMLIRFYRRWLTQYTPRCPHPVSCSAFALQAARAHGSIRGAALAWQRVRSCGSRAQASGYLGPKCDFDYPGGTWLGLWTPQRREGCLPGP